MKCSLVLTVNSSSLQTPALAEITKDVWQNKKLIIPAGWLAHGFAGKGHVRDRIDVSGSRLVLLWHFGCDEAPQPDGDFRGGVPLSQRREVDGSAVYPICPPWTVRRLRAASRLGGTPKKRRYSRLNCEALP